MRERAYRSCHDERERERDHALLPLAPPALAAAWPPSKQPPPAAGGSIAKPGWGLCCGTGKAPSASCSATYPAAQQHGAGLTACKSLCKSAGNRSSCRGPCCCQCVIPSKPTEAEETRASSCRTPHSAYLHAAAASWAALFCIRGCCQ